MGNTLPFDSRFNTKRLRFSARICPVLDGDEVYEATLIVLVDDATGKIVEITEYNKFLLEDKLNKKLNTRLGYAKFICMFLNYIFFDRGSINKSVEANYRPNLDNIINLTIDDGNLFLNDYKNGRVGEKGTKTGISVEICEQKLTAFYHFLVLNKKMNYLKQKHFKITERIVKIKGKKTLDNNFYKIDYQEQTKMIQKLGLAPYEVESMSRTLLTKQREVSILIDKMIQSDKSLIKPTLLTLLFGDAHSKHHFVKCLFRAISKHYSKDVLESTLFSSEQDDKCILPESETCFGCPFLIAEKWFLLELSERIWITVQKIRSARTEREKLKYNALLKIQKRILCEATLILGKDRINAYVSQALRRDLTVLEQDLNKMGMNSNGGG